MFFTGGKRVAFVVGVRDYDKFRTLNLSGHDASEMARQLTSLGFSVTTCLDKQDSDDTTDYYGTTDAELKKAWPAFLENAKGAEMAVFYFAGHGVEGNNENYLIAKDAGPLESWGKD